MEIHLSQLYLPYQCCAWLVVCYLVCSLWTCCGADNSCGLPLGVCVFLCVCVLWVVLGGSSFWCTSILYNWGEPEQAPHWRVQQCCQDGGVNCCWARPAYRTSLFVATKMASATEEQWHLKFSPQAASDDSTIPLTWLHVCVFHLAPHIGFLLLNPTLG